MAVVARFMIGKKLPEEAEIEIGAVVAGITRQDAVEIRWIALRFHQGLMAAGGTASEIRIARHVTIEVRHHRLCRDDAFMYRPMAPIGDGLVIVIAKVEFAALMPGIG